MPKLFIRLFACGLLALPTAAIVNAHAATSDLANVTAIAAGGPLACALIDSGEIKCWTSNHQAVAVSVPGISSGVKAIAVARGNDSGYLCAITTSGGVKCGGPDGLTSEVTGLPGAAVSISTAYKIVSGYVVGCAVLFDGALKCWDSRDHVASDVLGLSAKVKAVSVGIGHSCVVVTSGGAKCWGNNGSGQLGNGTTTASLLPVDVTSLAPGVISIKAGGGAGLSLYVPPGYSYDQSGHSCAVTSSGGVKCWGSNDSGQLGDGVGTSTHLTPFDVLGLTSGVIDLDAGAGSYFQYAGRGNFVNHPRAQTCAVTGSGGVKCWGDNCSGMISPDLPDRTSICLSQQPVIAPHDVLDLASGVIAVASGNKFNCALTTSATVRCWGYGFNGVQPVLVGTLSQAITFEPAPPVTVSGTVTISATGGKSGNPIVYSVTTPTSCSIVGTTVTGHARGLCTIEANQAGDSRYDPASPAFLTLMVGERFPQSINFGPLPTLAVGGTGLLSAVASSALTVAFTSNTPSICSVSNGNVVTGLLVGNCTIAASQSGNIEYNRAPEIAQTVSVSKGVQIIAFTSTPPSYYVPGGPTYLASATGGASGNPVLFSLDAASTIGTCSISGSIVTFTGLGSCIVNANQAGNNHYNAAALTQQQITVRTPNSLPRLANISTRTQVLTGNDVLIGGFIIGGAQAKTVVVRARGPSLIQAGVPNALGNPVLQLFSGQTVIAANDDWKEAANQAALAATVYAPSNNFESAILTTLNPGAYTAIVTGAGGTTGVGIIEVFEVDLPQVPLLNISTRGAVLTGNDVMIGGFIIQGDSPQTVTVRARGPSLIPFGITNALMDPVLQLFDGQVPVATNDDWQVQTVPSDVAAIQASGFAPTDSREAVIRITLQPGAYTAIVTGKNGTTGVGIVEVFAQ